MARCGPLARAFYMMCLVDMFSKHPVPRHGALGLGEQSNGEVRASSWGLDVAVVVDTVTSCHHLFDCRGLHMPDSTGLSASTSLC